MTLLVGSIFHMTRKIVSEMTYNVSMGTLNPTIPIPILSIADKFNDHPLDNSLLLYLLLSHYVCHVACFVHLVSDVI